MENKPLCLCVYIWHAKTEFPKASAKVIFKEIGGVPLAHYFCFISAMD